MRFILTISLFLIAGCVGRVDISQQNLSSEISEKCYSATKEMIIYSADTFPNPTYELISPKLNKLPWRTSLAPWKVKSTIAKGDVIRITKVYDQSYGTAGSCWEVFATLKSSSEIEFRIPACWVDHSVDNWVRPKYPWKQEKTNEKLRIDTDLLEEVTCI
ncbi:hypothetical protein [Paraferrimonas sedimenticola]|uniref:Lipoprotein n=1 Tax=Paraferrimonas sedimenticola TaxID=375674 RepID=A0AA37RVM1_9GAMM|nr:hypothetical protein [Paraferrimonas sedimenticola]GLP96530.1 hypothetical protein GCM10007895_18360 [Paraferrimonas sedimenticola]